MGVEHLHYERIEGGFRVSCACGAAKDLLWASEEGVHVPRVIFEAKHFGCRGLTRTKPEAESLELGPAANPAGGV